MQGTSISKRRSSRPIPPALVIEPPAPSAEDKKDGCTKPPPQEINRLTEFAEFATSPHSPLVQSPFPLTLTPGLLGAGSTPDWMTKSFTRFFFPDKPPSVNIFLIFKQNFSMLSMQLKRMYFIEALISSFVVIPP